MSNFRTLTCIKWLCIASILLSGCTSKVHDVFSEISTSISSSNTPVTDIAESTVASPLVASKTASPKTELTPTLSSTSTNTPLPSATHTPTITPLPTATPLNLPEILLPDAGTICEGAFNKNITGGSLVFPLTAFKKVAYNEPSTWERFDFIRYGSLQAPHLSPKDPTDSKMLVCVLQDRTYEFSYSTGTKGYSHHWRVRFIALSTLKVLEERSYSGPKPDSIISYFGTAPAAVYGDEPTEGDLYRYLLDLASEDLIIFSHTMSFYEAWFTPSRREISVLRTDDQILTYSLSNQQLLSERKSANNFGTSLHQAFDQGRQLAVLQYGQINIVNPETDVNLHAFWPEGEENYTNFWIAPNNKYLAALDSKNKIDIWNLENENRITQLSPDQTVMLAAWAPDASKLSVVDEKSLLRVWDFSTQTWASYNALVALDGINGEAFITGLAYAPDGSLLALGLRDGSLELLGLADLSLVDSLKSGSVLPLENLVWSEDGMLLAFSSYIDIYLATTSPLAIKQLLDGHRSQVLDLSFSADGSLLLSQSADSTVRVWRVE